VNTAIGCRDLEVHAGRRRLLRVDELDVPGGTCMAVLGPNGAGKSTLLRAIGRLTPHRVTGEVLLNGVPAVSTEVRMATAAVLQRPILRRGNVADNVASGLRFRGHRRRDAHERSLPWLAALGIADLGDRDVRTLSGGEVQRVCIARALATEPRVLLLDEPFGGLDAATRADLIADLRAALAGRGMAVVLVTHDVEEARALATSTALLIGGEIRALGPTATMLDTPVDLDTARLLGFVNHLPPALTGQNGDWVAKPEHCRVAVDARTHSPFSVRGTVRRVIPLGPVTRIDVAVSTSQVTCLHPAESRAEPGDDVTVHIDRACRISG
jgi:ABC-type sulfate/molybdate transport systems ATPase subunit